MHHCITDLIKQLQYVIKQSQNYLTNDNAKGGSRWRNVVTHSQRIADVAEDGNIPQEDCQLYSVRFLTG
jgi:hypothetical protein